MIEQIDIMSQVANAFSDFATLPQPNIAKQDIVEITRLATEIFDSNYLNVLTPKQEILWPLDRTQWIRVITNLIQNAIQAVPQSRTPKIEIKLVKIKKQIKVTIQDNGSGINPEDVDNIFEPRFTTQTGGMGLGLAIVKNIIESLNGTIFFESTPGVGTTFTIFLNHSSHEI